MSNVIRVCTLCDEQYPSGTYREHAAVHVPKRMSRAGGERSSIYSEVHRLVDGGVTQAEVARTLGISRQRVHQIVHAEPRGTAA